MGTQRRTARRSTGGTRQREVAITQNAALRAIPADADRDGAARRLLDLAVAGSALVALGPLMAAVAVAVRLTSPGPALFRQERVGRAGRPFVLWKFRTMHRGADDAAHRAYVHRLLTEARPPDGGRPGVYKLADDARLTPVGRWLRRTSVDELPQLFNVLAGDMSVVGPRPVLPWEVELFDRRHLARFRVKPGMTGLWQVSARNHVGMREALDMDVEYVRRRSLGLDLEILARTLPAVLRGMGAG